MRSWTKLEMMIIMEVSLFSRYSITTRFTNTFMNTVRTDRPSMLLRLRQKLMSLRNAKKSNTLCSEDTSYSSALHSNLTPVRINR